MKKFLFQITAWLAEPEHLRLVVGAITLGLMLTSLTLSLSGHELLVADGPGGGGSGGPE
jgi:hypothetical protein